MVLKVESMTSILGIRILDLSLTVLKVESMIAQRHLKTPPAAPKTPEKPLRSIDPSVERRLSVGAERVDKMAEKIRALRAMRA